MSVTLIAIAARGRVKSTPAGDLPRMISGAERFSSCGVTTGSPSSSRPVRICGGDPSQITIRSISSTVTVSAVRS